MHAQDTETLTVLLHKWIGVFGYKTRILKVEGSNFFSLLFNLSNYSHLKSFDFN